MTTLEDLLKSFARRALTIAVVGNGPVGRHGHTIDSFRCVVRFNNYRLDPPCTGTNTTLWVTNAWHDVPGDHAPLYVPTASPFHAEDDNGRVAAWSERWGREVVTPEHCWADEVRHKLKPKPSTGLLFLYACHQLGVHVVAFGFDGLRSGHHWDPDHTHDHPPEDEALRRLTSIAFVR